MEKREGRRNATRASVVCHLLEPLHGAQQTEGVLYNYSPGGSYIESRQAFCKGSVVAVRVLDYPKQPPLGTSEAWLQSFGLAEVKWIRQVGDARYPRYGLGLRYLQ